MRLAVLADLFPVGVIAVLQPARGIDADGPWPADTLFVPQQLAGYDQTIYSSVQSAPSFQYSWDQAVPPQEATPMLANLAQVFELTMTPQKFAATMDSQNSGA